MVRLWRGVWGNSGGGVWGCAHTAAGAAVALGGATFYAVPGPEKGGKGKNPVSPFPAWEFSLFSGFSEPECPYNISDHTASRSSP